MQTFSNWLENQDNSELAEMAQALTDKQLAKAWRKAQKCTPDAIAKYANVMGCQVVSKTNHNAVIRVADGQQIETIPRHLNTQYCPKILRNIQKYCPSVDAVPTFFQR